ncbi:envelope glycoprotein [Lonchura striata]|uniref:Envelope glycoprotein n=1 Tax=Lonchura striata TaxID=40157 RepID=A0A218VDK4_9PASE|nr:envelope glycoprotein [Lonchura striata domestica]
MGSPSVLPPLIRDLMPEVQQRAQSFWQGLAKEARKAETVTQEEIRTAPLPYLTKDGAGDQEDGRCVGALGGKSPEARSFANAHMQEKEESGRGCRANGKPCLILLPFKGETSPCGRQGEPRGWERHHPWGEEWGRSRTKRHRSTEMRWHSTSSSESSSSSSDSSEELVEAGWGSELERAEPTRFETKTNKALSHAERQSQCEPAQFTDWGKIKIACAEWAPAATIQAFPVRITGPEGNQQRIYAPVNPKDVQAIVKAISEKGINSAMVSTLVDGLFGNDDLLPFDIKQIGCMMFDGAGMIVFRQEWEDSCTRLLAQSSGARQPLQGSSLSRLIGKHNDMITPQQQATQMQTEEVRATGRTWTSSAQRAKKVVECANYQAPTTSTLTGRLAKSDPNPIFHMLEATFLSLNESNLNLTDSCWLCYDVKPPFYEGIALNTPFSYSTASAPHQCRWDTPRRGITLSQITGQGKCFGNATLAKQKGNFCTKVVKPNRKINKWVVPSTSGMWVCQQSGVSPCVFLAKFNDSINFCVQVLIVPRVLYHSDEEVYHLFEELSRLHKREIITGITIAMLLGLGAAGTATGVSAIATQQQGLSQLKMTVDEDLQRIKKSISYLEKSVSSLSEVVLQNRRGLDLLFMQQGGLELHSQAQATLNALKCFETVAGNENNFPGK